MVAEAEFAYAIPEKHKILQLFKNPNAVGFIAIEHNRIVGFISGLAHEYFFSNRKRVSDLGFFVLPEYRGSRAALSPVNPNSAAVAASNPTNPDPPNKVVPAGKPVLAAAPMPAVVPPSAIAAASNNPAPLAPVA